MTEVKEKTRKKGNKLKKELPKIESGKSKKRIEESESVGDELSVEARQKLIEETAYRRALARNFEGDAQLDDWLEAEAEVNEKFTKAKALT